MTAESEPLPPTSIDAGNGYRVVNWYSVALNGLYYRVMPITDADPLALLLPTGRAAMNSEGDRPYSYATVEEALEDARVLQRYDLPVPDPNVVLADALRRIRGLDGVGAKSALEDIATILWSYTEKGEPKDWDADTLDEICDAFRRHNILPRAE